MPTYEITAPDGKTYEITAPEGATQEQAFEKFKANYDATNAAPVETPVEQPRSDYDWGKSNMATRDQYMSPEATKSMGENIGSLATGLVQGGMVDPGNLAGMPSRFLHETLRKLPGGQYLSSAVNAIIPEMPEATAIPRILPKGEDTSVDMLRTGGEWAAPLGMLGKVGKADALIGGTAATTEELFDDEGGMFGGIGATIASLFRGKPKTGTPAHEKAKEFITESARDPSSIVGKLRESLDSGQTGTLAELTRDPGVFNLEATAGRGTTLQARLDELSQGRIDQQATNIGEQLGGEVPYRPLEQVQEKAATRTNRLEKAIAAQEARNTARGVGEIEAQLPQAEQALVQAQIDANLAQQTIDTPLKPSEASTKLSETYAQEQKQVKDLVTQPAWNKFDQGQPVSAQEFKDSVVDWADENLSLTEATMLKNKFGEALSLVKNLGDEIQPKEVQSIISEIKRINNAASGVGGTFTSANKFLSEMGRVLEDGLEALPGSAYETARDATKAEKGRFEPSRVGKEREVREATTLGQRLLDTKEGGAAVGDLLLAAKSPAIEKAAETYIKSIAKADGLNDAFLKNYDELLDRFPDLKGQLEQAKQAQDLLDVRRETVTKLPGAIKKQAGEVTQAKAAKAKGLSESVAKTQVSKLKANPEKFLDDSLKGSVEDLTKVNKQLSRVEGGQEALKTAIKARVLDKIVKSKGGDTQIPVESVEEFNSIKRNLVDSGIFTKDEIVEIENRLADVAEIKKLRSASGVQKAKDVDTILEDVLASGISMKALDMLPNSKNQLMFAGVVRRTIGKLIKNQKYDKNTLAALEEILKNPEKFLEDAVTSNALTEKRFAQYLNQVGKAVTQSVSEDE